MREYEAVLQRLGTPMRRFPALIVGTSVLQGEDEIRSGFAEAVNKALNESAATAGTPGQPPPPLDVDTASLPPEHDVLPDLLFFPVLAAGLVDGINPCAFSTLIFLIVSLAYVGKSRRAILLTGIFFTLSIFITYYLLGLIGTGFLSFLRNLPFAPIILVIVRIILIVLLFVFAGLSIYDFILIRKGRAGEMVLQLPKKIKQRIHSSVRAYVSSLALVSGALILGFYVSVFELACTGQIYFPVIAVLAQLESNLSAYFYLALYNVGFIIPLAGVFVFIYLGVRSEKLISLFQKHMGLVKIVLAGVFIALALIMILT
jgi:cytochrome c biogenesis protein CcdA